MDFNVLGPVTVTEGSDSLNIGGPKQRTVLAMLISRAGQPLTADAIGQAVYGDDASARSRRAVQTYVSSLRSVVGEVIVKDGAAWSLVADRAAVDATRFEDLYESARALGADAAAEVLREALAMWRSDPYSGVEAHGLLDGEITRLGGLRIGVQQARIDADLESGRDSDLAGELEALVAEHPYQERFRAQHMLALYRAGRQGEALRSYRQMREFLVDELGVDPAPELQQLEQRILEQDDSLLLTAQRSTSSSAPPETQSRLSGPARAQKLLEREDELDLLAGVLAELGSSGGRVVLVHGEAGIGKSALVREFLALHGDEANVLFGSCDDLLTPQPLGPFWDIAREEPSLFEALENGNRPGVLAAALDLLARPQRPTVLVVEDTHWADEATLDAIKFLGRRIVTSNSLLVVTYRDEEFDFEHPLRGVIGDLSPDGVVRIQLGGLSREAVSSAIAGSDLDAGQVFEATDGNPLLVKEMAAVEGDTIPASVQDSVMARVGKLTAHAHEGLTILSVIPERITTEEISQLIGGTQGWLVECERRGLVEVGDGFVRFQHELIRRAVEQTLTPSEKVALNAMVLQSLPRDTDPARMVHHAVEAHDIAALVEFAPAAARAAAAVGSHREAVEHYRQLNPHIDRLAAEIKGPILDAWAGEEGAVRYVSGGTPSLSEAIRVNGLARAHYRQRGDRPAESAALAYEVRLCHWSGQRSRAEQHAREAIEVLGPDPAGRDLARALDANALMAGGRDNDACLELVERALEAAGPDIDDSVLSTCLKRKGFIAHLTNYPAGRASFEEAAQLAQTIGDWTSAWVVIVDHASLAIEFRDFPAAADLLERALAIAQRDEQPVGVPYTMVLSATLLDFKAEWEQAEDLARQHLQEDYHRINTYTLPVIGVIEARRALPTAAATLEQAWEAVCRNGEVDREAAGAAAIAEHAWIYGRAVVPIFELTAVLEAAIGFGLKWSSGSVAMWLWKLGELAGAPDGIAEPYRLVIEGEPMAAAELWAEIGCPYERAIALAHGDTNARLEALEIVEALGATAVAAKLRQELSDQGVAAPSGWGAETKDHRVDLTARQAEILSLLAEGLSDVEMADRLFLTPRLVEHHLAALMSKLESSSRKEALATAAEFGLLASS